VQDSRLYLRENIKLNTPVNNATTQMQIPDYIILLRVHKNYSLRFILLFASMDVSRRILDLDTFILTKSNMGPRE
jgi:hypothetical protein